MYIKVCIHFFPIEFVLYCTFAHFAAGVEILDEHSSANTSFVTKDSKVGHISSSILDVHCITLHMPDSYSSSCC